MFSQLFSYFFTVSVSRYKNHRAYYALVDILHKSMRNLKIHLQSLNCYCTSLETVPRICKTHCICLSNKSSSRIFSILLRNYKNSRLEFKSLRSRSHGVLTEKEKCIRLRALAASVLTLLHAAAATSGILARVSRVTSYRPPPTRTILGRLFLILCRRFNANIHRHVRTRVCTHTVRRKLT